MIEQNLKGKPEELIQAEQLITENQYEEALQVLIELEKKENLYLTHKISCLVLQGRILLWQGKYEGSVKILKQAYEESLGLEKNLQTLDPLIIMALVYNWQGKFDKSYELIKKSEDLFKTFTKESSTEYIL